VKFDVEFAEAEDSSFFLGGGDGEDSCSLTGWKPSLNITR